MKRGGNISVMVCDKSTLLRYRSFDNLLDARKYAYNCLYTTKNTERKGQYAEVRDLGELVGKVKFHPSDNRVYLWETFIKDGTKRVFILKRNGKLGKRLI